MSVTQCSSLTDARRLFSGSYTGWLVKAKSEDAKGRWFSSSTKRLFTIDYENQVFFYAHSETKTGAKAKTSVPIGFGDILGASLCPVPTGHGFGFLVLTKGKEFKLFAERDWEADLWVTAFLGAKNKADACGAPSTNYDDDASTAAGSQSPSSSASTPTQRSRSPRSSDALRHAADGWLSEPACAFAPPPRAVAHAANNPAHASPDPFAALSALEELAGPAPAQRVETDAVGASLSNKHLREARLLFTAGVKPSSLSQPWWGEDCPEEAA